MCGWAFMIKGEAHTLGGLPLIDDGFRWWCGDDDLAFQIQRLGYKIGRVNGLPVDHLGEASIPRHSELHRIKWEDMVRFKAKYGET
jgi:GT2 family glycosyltransferase